MQVIYIPGDSSTPVSTMVDPNPVVAELQLAGAPPKAQRILKPKKPKPSKPSAAAPAASPFPDPAQASMPVTPSR